MNSLNTLYFPGTDIYSIRQYPLFLLFRNIHIIKPVEDTPTDAEEQPADSFINSSFCQVHTPCPLGENRKRFLHLVNDIKTRKDDYAAQLSSLTLAAMSRGSAAVDSEQEIINSIFAPQDLQQKGAQEEKELKLWQARLVLKIGEVLDLEEEEIAGHLAVLKDEQDGLFKALQGEGEVVDDEENLFAELSQLTEQLGADHHGNAKKRYLAWKTLFLESSLQKNTLFVTTSPDSGDLLQESYEEESGQAALNIGAISLPAIIGWDYNEACRKALYFHDKYSDIGIEVAEQLTQLSQMDLPKEDGMQPSTIAPELFSSLQNSVDKEFPAETHGRIQVTLYMLPGLSGAAVLGHPRAESQKITNGLLMIIS